MKTSIVKQDHTLELVKELGLDPDFTPAAAGSYIPVNVRGNIAYVAIQFPIIRSGYLFLGRLGAELTTEEGYQAARKSALNVLGQINKFVGFENIDGLNHIDVYYQASPGWDEGTIVANSASDLFMKVLGLRGMHTRALLGVHSLPKNLSVGVKASFTLL